MQIRRRGIAYILSIIVLLTAVACQSERSSLIIDDDDMEDLLYDVHCAHFMNTNGNDIRESGAKEYAVFLNVLKKHGVTQEQWDSSMVYYCCHADELKDIYKNLSTRLEDEAEAVGASVTNSEDSTNIWRGEKCMILTSFQPYTTRQWELKTDSLVKPGERINLRFVGMFLQPEDEMRAECVLYIKLSNDSIAVSTQTMTRTGIYNVTIVDRDKIGIKEIKGMFMMHKNNVNSYSLNRPDNNASQILCVRDLSLQHTVAETEAPDRKGMQLPNLDKNVKATFNNGVPKRLELQDP